MRHASLAAAVALLWVGFVNDARTADPRPAMKTETLSLETGYPVSCRYWVAFPAGYDADPAARWPLLIFLHGAGERGDQLDAVKKHGPLKIIENGTPLPFLVIAPQCPAGDWWESTRQSLTLAALLDAVVATHRIDPDRIYCTGLSMGGYGTWRFAMEHADRVAAVIPICGGGRWFAAAAMKEVPAWAFHGAKDTVVPLEESKKMVDALARAGGRARLTVYPDAAHDAWTETYANPDVYEWLLRHRRGAPSPDGLPPVQSPTR